MPYYSVRITGGEDCHARGVEARHHFGGREADYTGTGGFFYVHRNHKKDILLRNMKSFLGNQYEVEIKRISMREYNWRQHRNA